MSASRWPWPAPSDDGAAAHLAPGTALPAMMLASTRGVSFDLSRTSGRAVVFVYPWTGCPGLPNPPDWDHIPGAHGSTPELERVRDLLPEFESLGCSVFALSGQSSAYQAELATRLRLSCTVLSDEGLAFSRALGLPTFVTGGVSYLKRLTLIVGHGKIVQCFYPAHPPDTHPDVVLAHLASAIRQSE